MKYCSTCGTQLDGTAAFCGECGTAVSGRAPSRGGDGAGAAASAGNAEGGSGSSTTTVVEQSPGNGRPTVTAAPAGEVPANSPLQVAAPSTRLAPPAAPPAGRGRTGLIVGIVVALVAAVAAWQFLSGPDPAPLTPDDDRGGSQVDDPNNQGNQPDDNQGGSQVDDPNNQGNERGPSACGGDQNCVQPEPPPVDPNEALASIVPTTVGSYELDDVSEMPALIDVGAAGSLQMTYVSGGSSIYHALAAFDGPAQSVEFTHGYAAYLVEEIGLSVIADQPLDTGHAYVLEQDGTLTIVWSNDLLWGLVEGPGEAVQEFFPQLPY